MKVYMYIMSNDVKWMEREDDIPFAPYPGLGIEGVGGEHQTRVSTMSWDTVNRHIRCRLAWMSDQPLTSAELVKLNVGWKELKGKPST